MLFPIDYILEDTSVYFIGVAGDDAQYVVFHKASLNKLADPAQRYVYQPVTYALSYLNDYFEEKPALARLSDSTFSFLIDQKKPRRFHLNGSIDTIDHLKPAITAFNYKNHVYLGGIFVLQGDTVPLVRLLPGTTTIDSSFILNTPSNVKSTEHVYAFVPSKRGIQLLTKVNWRSRKYTHRLLYDTLFQLHPDVTWGQNINKPEYTFITDSDTFLYRKKHIKVLGNSTQVFHYTTR